MDEHTRRMALDFNIIPTITALSGGEDYELLFTIRQEDYEWIRETEGITVVGHMTASGEGKYLITTDGKQVPLSAQGWDGMREKETAL